MVANRDWSGCRQTLKTYSRSIVLVTVPITLGLVAFSHPLIKILFQRGAFTVVDTKIVSRVQAFLSLQIPFYILANLGVRLVSALKRNSVLMVIAGVNMVVNIVFNLILMRYAGVAGIALSTSFVYLVSCVLVYASITKTLRRLGALEEAHGNSRL
jgi:putative peptidoglycan lipid II flippase